MENRRKFSNLIGAGAVVAASVVPATLSAQDGPYGRGAWTPTYHLMQLSVKPEKVAPDKFKAAAEGIRSCGDARKVAKSLGADVKRDRFVRSTALPEDLRTTLDGLEPGHTTEVFSEDGEVMRVIVLCNRAS